MAEEVQVHSPDKEVAAESNVVYLPAPEGWKKQYFPKKKGTPRRHEIIFVAPTGEEIKTRSQLDKYLRTHPGGPPISEFHWSTGDTPRRSSRLSEKAQAEAETPESEVKKRTPKRGKKGDGDTEDSKQSKKSKKSEEASAEKDEEMKDVEEEEKAEEEDKAGSEDDVDKENKTNVDDETRTEDKITEDFADATCDRALDDKSTEEAKGDSEKDGGGIPEVPAGAGNVVDDADAKAEEDKGIQHEPKTDDPVPKEEAHVQEASENFFVQEKDEKPKDEELKEASIDMNENQPKEEAKVESHEDLKTGINAGYENGDSAEPVVPSQPESQINPEGQKSISQGGQVADHPSNAQDLSTDALKPQDLISTDNGTARESTVPPS